jgi:hypothetical protein
MLLEYLSVKLPLMFLHTLWLHDSKQVRLFEIGYPFSTWFLSRHNFLCVVFFILRHCLWLRSYTAKRRNDWKHSGIKHAWPKRRHYIEIWKWAIMKIAKCLMQASWCPGRNLHDAPHEYMHMLFLLHKPVQMYFKQVYIEVYIQKFWLINKLSSVSESSDKYI